VRLRKALGFRAARSRKPSNPARGTHARAPSAATHLRRTGCCPRVRLHWPATTPLPRAIPPNGSGNHPEKLKSPPSPRLQFKASKTDNLIALRAPPGSWGTFSLLCSKPGFELLKCPRFEVRKQTTSTRVFETSRFKNPLVLDPPSISLGFEEVSKLRWARVGGRTSTRRVKYELRGLPFMLPIMAPVGVEAASHIFASLAIGAAPPVTGKRRRGR